MKSIVVWFNPNKNVYYYKLVCNLFDHYFIGFKNQYGHIVILVIDLYKDNILYKESISKKVLKKLISFLQNIYKKL